MEFGSTFLLTATICCIILIEDFPDEIARPCQFLVFLHLRGGVVELRPLLTQKEVEVNLSIVVGKRRLGRMTQESCTDAYYKDIETPCCPSEERNRFVPQPHHDSDIYCKEPDVSRESVEHTAHKRLLARESGQLSVGGVAEIGKHQQHHSPYVRHYIVILEHPSCSSSEEYRQYGDGIGMNAQFLPHQCESQSYWPCEMHVKPFLRVFRLERCF